MSVIYCGSCFHKNEYQGVRPTVCENCDKPFAKAFEVEKPAKAAHHPRHGWTDHQNDGDSESQEIDEFLSTVSIDLQVDGRAARDTSSHGGVRKELGLPTIKQVNAALGGTGGGEVIQREIPDLTPALQADGRVKSLGSIKNEYMKDMLAQAKADEARASAAAAAQPKPRKRRKAS